MSRFNSIASKTVDAAKKELHETITWADAMFQIFNPLVDWWKSLLMWGITGTILLYFITIGISFNNPDLAARGLHWWNMFAALVAIIIAWVMLQYQVATSSGTKPLPSWIVLVLLGFFGASCLISAAFAGQSLRIWTYDCATFNASAPLPPQADFMFGLNPRMCVVPTYTLFQVTTVFQMVYTVAIVIAWVALAVIWWKYLFDWNTFTALKNVSIAGINDLADLAKPDETQRKMEISVEQLGSANDFDKGRVQTRDTDALLQLQTQSKGDVFTKGHADAHRFHRKRRHPEY